MILTDMISDIPLNVVVLGDTVTVILPNGAKLAMTASAAERSAQRLLDALALATGHLPEPRSHERLALE